jgi:putative membrane protein insertion efficiency factor
MNAPHTIGWRAGTPARWLLLASIRVYRSTAAGWLGGQCRFYPSCSHYAETAIRTHGAIRGSALAIWRILRCNPYGAGGVEPVPARRAKGAPLAEHQDDSVIHTRVSA